MMLYDSLAQPLSTNIYTAEVQSPALLNANGIKQRLQVQQFYESPATQLPCPKAAVLILLVASSNKENNLSVLITCRSRRLNHHAGQMCFPGGRSIPHETSAIQTALREAKEEVGINNDDVEVLGILPDMLTRGSGFVTSAVVGYSPRMPILHLDPVEVDYAFLVPLSALLNPCLHGYHVVTRDNPSTYRFTYTVGRPSWNIWGVTAQISRQLYRAIYN